MFYSCNECIILLSLMFVIDSNVHPCLRFDGKTRSSPLVGSQIKLLFLLSLVYSGYAYIIKPLTPIINVTIYIYITVFVPASNFHPSLIFAGKAKSLEIKV
jgi:hypothetical protein